MSVENSTWMLVKALQINFFSRGGAYPEMCVRCASGRVEVEIPKQQHMLQCLWNDREISCLLVWLQKVSENTRNRASRWPLTLTVHSFSANVKFNWRWKIRTTLLLSCCFWNLAVMLEPCSGSLKRKVWLSLSASLEPRNMQIFVMQFLSSFADFFTVVFPNLQIFSFIINFTSFAGLVNFFNLLKLCAIKSSGKIENCCSA